MEGGRGGRWVMVEEMGSAQHPAPDLGCQSGPAAWQQHQRLAQVPGGLQRQKDESKRPAFALAWPGTPYTSLAGCLLPFRSVGLAVGQGLNGATQLAGEL